MAATIPQLTEYAKKYGVKKNTDQSGLTPLAPIFPTTIPLSNQAKNAIRATELYQQKKLGGFTSRELVDLDTLTAIHRDLKAGDLPDYIHPLFERWETSPSPSFQRIDVYPLSNGNGNWLMSNPEVRKIMLPTLRIASKLLMSQHVLPWFAALIDGQRRPIPQSRIRQIKCQSLKNMYSFNNVPGFNQGMQAYYATRRDHILKRLRTYMNLTFGFGSTTENPTDPSEDPPNEGDYGETVMNIEEMEQPDEIRDPAARWGIWIFLYHQNLEPLFRADLTSADRMSIEYSMANTIVHECLHAFAILCPETDPPPQDEPYYERDAIAEVGYRFEIAINGGILRPFFWTPKLPLGHWLDTSWPTFEHRKASIDRPVLQNPGVKHLQVSYPIPLSVYSDIQQIAFWDVGVRNYGHALLHYRTLQQGYSTKISIRTPHWPIDPNIVDPLLQYPLDFTPARREPGPNFEAEFRQQAGFAFAQQLGIEVQKQLANAQQTAKLLALTPEQRAVVAFGQAMVYVSNAEQGFWNSTVSQRRIAGNIHTALKMLPQNQQSQQAHTVCELLVGSVGEARMAHELAVMATEILESRSGTAYTDRILELLELNMRTRQFAREVEAQAGAVNEQFSALLSEDIIAFELFRYKLWHPGSNLTPTASRDHEEIDDMIRMRRPVENKLTQQNVKEMCLQYESDSSRSITSQICARIILSAIERQNMDGWVARFQRLQTDLKILGWLKLGAPATWVSWLLGWENSAKELLETLQRQLTQQQAQEPQHS